MTPVSPLSVPLPPLVDVPDDRRLAGFDKQATEGSRQDKKTASLYANDNGMVVCIFHGGSYLSSEYRHAPEADTYRTPIEGWQRIDEGYAAEFLDVVGRAPRCEMCR